MNVYGCVCLFVSVCLGVCWGNRNERYHETRLVLSGVFCNNERITTGSPVRERGWQGIKLTIYKTKVNDDDHDDDDDGVVSLANSDPLFGRAIVADDWTTPVKTTVTAFGPFLTDDVVAATATKWLTIVQLVARLVTTTSGDSWIVDVGPFLAEIRRTFVKEKIRVADATGKLPAFATASGFVAQLRLVD